MYAIAQSVDANYLVAAFVALNSIATVVPLPERAEIAVHLTTPDITPAQAHTARDLIGRLGFRSCSIRRVPPPPAAWLRHGAYITEATYLRFALPAADVDRPYVVHLDADVVVLADPAQPFNHITPGHVGVVVDEIVQSIGRDHALPGFVDRYPHHQGAPYYNAGATWLATVDLDRFRTGSITQLRHHRRHIYFNDQDALNLWLLRQQAAIQLPAAYNRFELDRFRERSDWITRASGPPRSLTAAAIVHFVGSNKPWLPTCPRTEAVTAYRRQLNETRRHLRRLGDLVLDIPDQPP